MNEPDHYPISDDERQNEWKNYNSAIVHFLISRVYSLRDTRIYPKKIQFAISNNWLDSSSSKPIATGPEVKIVKEGQS